MKIKDIYKEIHNIEDRIYNKEDKKSVLDDINKVHYDIMQLPFYKLFIEVIRLYEKEYNTCLLANVGGQQCKMMK